jgi:hypothetical protein
VHDIGKPRALAEGDKYKQYEYSQVYAAEILKGLGLKEQEIKIGLSLISGDPIGQYLKTDNSGKCVKEIIKMAAMADVRPVDFLKILEIFYEADAAAYTKDATIKNVVKGEKALDFLFEFDQENKKIEFAPDVKNRMERLKTEIELVSSGKEAKGIEKELSPELIEKIMDKVEDVNKKGMAYHVLGAASSEVKSMGVLNVLKRDLQFGLLGNMGRVSPRKNLIEEYSKFKDQNPSFSEKNWAKSVRKFKPAPVFFNIVGRSEISLWNRRLYPYAKFEIANSTWVRSKEDKIVITFDLSKFKEVEDIELFKNPENLKTNTYYNDCPSVGSPGYANTEEGFILSSRVAPRFFKGIVFNLLSNEKNDKGENIRKDCTDPVMMQERADEIVSTMKEAYKNREDMLLPVYDVYGNLYWPKNMNYKEVKKFVAEKNKEKGLDSPDVIKQNIKETKRLNKGKRFIFDDDGNLLWPKKMSYEEVKQFVAERDKNKKNEKTT